MPFAEVTSLAESYEFCRVLTRQTAHNFRFSFLTLPRAQRRAMDVFYAFNRITDDLGDDETQTIEVRSVKLAEWRAAVRNSLEQINSVRTPYLEPIARDEACGSSRTLLRQSDDSHRALPALADVVCQYQLPHEVLFDVIDGVEMDLQPVEIGTIRELERYCYHVAGAVGIGCIHIWGFRDDPVVKPLAIDCGLALQLTNILRDLAEDVDRGRIYLPREDLQRFGYSPDELRRRVTNDAFRALMKFEADRARKYYESSERLFQYLDRRGKPILRAMIDIYRGLLDEIVCRDFDVFHNRVSLSKFRKLWLAGRAVAKHWLGLPFPNSSTRP